MSSIIARTQAAKEIQSRIAEGAILAGDSVITATDGRHYRLNMQELLATMPAEQMAKFIIDDEERRAANREFTKARGW